MRNPSHIYLLLATVLVGCTFIKEPLPEHSPPLQFTLKEQKHILRLSPVPPSPPNPTNNWADDPAAAAFGRLLFYDSRFSKNGRISCSTCHKPERAWTDGLALSLGLSTTSRHAPSLWNVDHQRWLFWDGRADSLWAQALEPLEDPREHGGSRLQYAHLISSDEQLRSTYESLFGPFPDLSDVRRFPSQGRPLNRMERNNTALELPSHVLSWNSMSPQDQDTVTSVFVHMGKALAAFQRTFRSTNAPFDIFVDGLRENNSTKKAALTTAAQRGLKLFLGKARCHICHDGPLFTDLEFHDTGVRPISDALPPDLGRRSGISALLDNPFNGTGQWSDEPNGNARYKVDFLSDTPSTTGQFKTPSLRNVSKTEPYMHQGQLTTLKDVVAFYATLEEADISGIEETILQPLTLDEQQQSDLVTFLESLEDSEPSAALLALPPAQ